MLQWFVAKLRGTSDWCQSAMHWIGGMEVEDGRLNGIGNEGYDEGVDIAGLQELVCCWRRYTIEP